MPRLEKARRRMATLDRRALLAAAPAALLAACEPKMPITASTTPKIDLAGLTNAVVELTADAKPGILGVGLLNLESGEAFVYHGERRFPMQSVFKLPLAAAVLSEIDARRLTLDERIFLSEAQLSPQLSPIAAAWPGRKDYAVSELLEAMVVGSDNTAADVLMKRIGGPGAVSAWLVAKACPEIRVDRYERELQTEMYGLGSFRPAWRDPTAFDAAFQKVPADRRLAATRDYMADPRDTASPRGMLEFLQKLDRLELISPASTRMLLAMMRRTTRGADRLKAGLPKDALLAHRPGTSGVDQGLSAAHNDVGLFTLADRRTYAIAVFLSGCTADEATRDRIIAQVARAAVVAIG